MTKGNDLAHPTNIIDPERQFEPEYHTGLTKREYFAAMALQGMLAEQWWTSPENLARCSTEAADALIKALNDKP